MRGELIETFVEFQFLVHLWRPTYVIRESKKENCCCYENSNSNSENFGPPNKGKEKTQNGEELKMVWYYKSTPTVRKCGHSYWI